MDRGYRSTNDIAFIALPLFSLSFFGTRGFEGWVTMGGEGIRKADKVLGMRSDLRFGFLGSIIPSLHGVIGFGRGFCVICTIIYHLG